MSITFFVFALGGIAIVWAGVYVYSQYKKMVRLLSQLS